MTDTNKEGLYTSAKNLLPNDAHSKSCGCGHDHGARGDEAARGEEAKDYTDPDVVREDGTNPAVRTVDEAEGYNQDAAWNDGVRPEAAGNAEASGASESDKEQIN